MRLVVLLLFAATVVSSASSTTPGEASRPVIVLVHGRGQLGQDTAALRREWKRDLDSALATVGMPRLRDADVRLAWYADVLDPDADGLCASASVSIDSMGFGELARGFLGFLASAVSEDGSGEMRGLMGDLLYAIDPSKRCDAEQRVGNVIEAATRENRPVIVVAYSLGSLVTYGYLTSRAPTAKRLHGLRLITLGSPLGVRAIREMVFGESVDTLGMPEAVSAWENVYDPNDFLSAPLEGILSARVLDRTIRPGPVDDPHNLGRYLRDRATGAAVMRALCETAKDEFSACATLEAPGKTPP